MKIYTEIVCDGGCKNCTLFGCSSCEDNNTNEKNVEINKNTNKSFWKFLIKLLS